jgi:hypothetical protein
MLFVIHAPMQAHASYGYMDERQHMTLTRTCTNWWQSSSDAHQQRARVRGRARGHQAHDEQRCLHTHATLCDCANTIFSVYVSMLMLAIYIYIYIYTYIYIYIHSYIHTYIHAYSNNLKCQDGALQLASARRGKIRKRYVTCRTSAGIPRRARSLPCLLQSKQRCLTVLCKSISSYTHMPVRTQTCTHECADASASKSAPHASAGLQRRCGAWTPFTVTQTPPHKHIHIHIHMHMLMLMLMLIHIRFLSNTHNGRQCGFRGLGHGGAS